MTAPSASPWPLDPSITFLNHGSFGCCPRPVLEAQTRLRAEMEGRPIEFLARSYEERLDAARADLADFLTAPEDELVFVPNATYGVNSVLRSLRFEPGDELLVTDHEYNACRNVLDFVAEGSGARVVVAPLPWPVADPEEIVAAVLAAATDRTRLLLIDHVTSPTALVLPLERLLAELQPRGVRVLVDGAHAPGQIPLDLTALGADWYTGNCHKWLNAPKGAGFLYVPRAGQDEIRPACISHGANEERPGRARFRLEFDWTGTHDPSAWLAVPAAIDFIEQAVDGGWPALRERNHGLAVAARANLLEAVGAEAPAPAAMLGAMASVPLPVLCERPVRDHDPLQTALREQYRIEVPVITWGGRDGLPTHRCVRISAQLYNEADDYSRLASALSSLGAASAPV